MKVGPQKFTEIAKQWEISYKKNKLVGVIKLFNAVLLSAGVKPGQVLTEDEDELLDLDALDTDEMTETLEMATNSIDGIAPIESNNKGGENFRSNFGGFFQKLVTCIMTSSAEADVKRMDDTLKSIVEPFVMMTSFSHAAYRVAFTEATMHMAVSLVTSNRTLSDSITTHQRLIKAEEEKSGAGRATEKFKTLKKQLEGLEKKAKICEQFSAEIFASVFVHRSKDSREDVRSRCMTHLGELIMAWPEKYLVDDYLKYIGWTLTDPSDNVRRATAAALLLLVDHETLSAVRLPEFVTRFHEKMLHLAAQDRDTRVCLLYTEILRKLYEKALLDDLQDEELHLVDQVIFDHTADDKTRMEALEFLMSHTTGFDDDMDEDGEGHEEDDNAGAGNTTKTKGKAKGKAKKSNDETKALARRQKHALQIETLTEFVEHFQKDPARYDEGARMLTDVCLRHDQLKTVLRDWSTITALLLRESDDKITVSLRPAQAAILLRMYTASAEQISDIMNQEQTQNRKVNSEFLAEWNQLNDVLQKDLAKLLKRFSDDRDNLDVLLRLLCCGDFGDAVKSLKPLLKVLEGILETATAADEPLIAKVCTAFRKWSLIGEQGAGAVEPVMTAVFKATWKKVEEATRVLQKVTSAPISKKGQSKKGESGSPLENAMHSLHIAVTKQRAMWSAVDCRSISQIDSADCVDQLIEVMDCVVGLAEGEAVSGQKELYAAAISCAKSASETVLFILMWFMRESTNALTEAVDKHSATQAKMKKRDGKKKAKVDAEEAEENDEEMAVVDQSTDFISGEELDNFDNATSQVLDIRAKLVDALVTWMLLGRSEEGDDGEAALQGTESTMHVDLQRFAFRITNDLRCLFPARVKDHHYVDRLVFVPSQEVLTGLRRVFELEGSRARSSLSRVVDVEDEDEDDDNDDEDGGDRSVKRASRTGKSEEALLHLLLSSLSTTIAWDTDNLNRRQTAAILAHLLDDDKRVVEVVKGLAKTLKVKAPSKYLEVQMVSLKSIYAESVAPYYALYLQAVEGSPPEDYDEKANGEAVDRGRERVKKFAEAYATNWGPRLNEQAASSLVNFFKVAIDYAVEEPNNHLFVEALLSYFRFTTKDGDLLLDLTEHLQAKVDEIEGLQAEIKASKTLGTAVLANFQKSQLPNAKKPRKQDKRLSMTSYSMIEDDEDDVFAGKQLKQAKPKPKPKSRAKPKSAKLKVFKPPTKSAPSRAVRSKVPKYKDSDDDEDEDEEDEEVEKTLISDKTLAKNAVAKKPTQSRGRQAQVYRDESDDEEEEEEEVEKTLISDKTLAKKASDSGAAKAVSSLPKTTLSLEPMGSDDDPESESDAPEKPPQPHAAVSSTAGSKRGRAVITESQELILQTISAIPARKRYR